MDDPLDDFFTGQIAGEVRVEGEEMSDRTLAAEMRMRQLARLAQLPAFARLGAVNNLSTQESGDSGVTANFNNHTGSPPLLYLSPSDKYMIPHYDIDCKSYIQVFNT